MAVTRVDGGGGQFLPNQNSVRIGLPARHQPMKTDKVKEQFITLYNAEADAVFRFCLLRTKSRETALDLTQDTFSRLWDSLLKKVVIQNGRAFIFTIARNLLIDYYRKPKPILESEMENKNEEDAENKFFNIPAKGTSVVDLELGAEGRYLLDKLADLPADYKEVVYLRFVEDLKPQEIAEVLGESANTISVRINRGLDKLRELTGYNLNYEE